MVALSFEPVNVDDFGVPDVVAFAGVLSGWLAAFEPDTWSATQARGAVEVFARLRRLADAGLALAAGRVERTGAWAVGTDRSAAGYVARVAGTTVGRAEETIRTAGRLDELGATNDAFRAGELLGGTSRRDRRRRHRGSWFGGPAVGAGGERVGR